MAPSLSLLLLLFAVPHKEYRFLFPLLPTFAFAAGAAFDKLRLAGRVRGLEEGSWRRGIGCWVAGFLIGVHMFSGVSLLALQVRVE